MILRQGKSRGGQTSQITDLVILRDNALDLDTINRDELRTQTWKVFRVEMNQTFKVIGEM